MLVAGGDAGQSCVLATAGEAQKAAPAISWRQGSASLAKPAPA